MTSEQKNIVDWLRSNDPCDTCTYKSNCGPYFDCNIRRAALFIERMAAEDERLDAENLLLTSLRDRLIEKNTHLEEALEQVTRERDAAVSDMVKVARGGVLCDVCADMEISRATGIERKCQTGGECEFQWRGVCAENGGRNDTSE